MTPMGKRLRSAAALTSLAVAATAFNLLLSGISTRSHRSRCADPAVLIHVLTMNRPASLRRLLDGLLSSEYGCAPIDVHVSVDALPVSRGVYSDIEEAEERQRYDEVLAVAMELADGAGAGAGDGDGNNYTAKQGRRWPHGRVTVHRRVVNAGLRTSWLEGILYGPGGGTGGGGSSGGSRGDSRPQTGEIEYVAIFEDDMAVSPLWYRAVAGLHRGGILNSNIAEEGGDSATADESCDNNNNNNGIASFCLHPIGDGRMNCDADGKTESKVLYTLQFACSWGPVWPVWSWRDFVNFSHNLLEREEGPFIPDEADNARNINRWVRSGSDVQSAYVKRYLLEEQKRTLVYSLTRCNEGRDDEGTFLAINKKEAGVHYAKAQKHLTSDSLLARNATIIDEILGKGGRRTPRWGNGRTGVVPPPPQNRITPRSWDWEEVRRRNCYGIKPTVLGNTGDDGRPIDRPLPTPVVVIGMPKTGTTTIDSFFRSAGFNTSHWWCGGGKWNHTFAKTYPRGYCGKCIADAVLAGQPPLASCGGYDVWAQMDVTLPQDGLCHMPQVEYLQEIHDEAPRATFIMNTRNVTKWVRSMHGWSQFEERFVKCGTATRLNGTDEKSLETYFLDHIKMARDFVRRNPSHALVELDIEDDGAGCEMAELFGVDSKFWMQQNKSPNKNGNT